MNFDSGNVVRAVYDNGKDPGGVPLSGRLRLPVLKLVRLLLALPLATLALHGCVSFPAAPVETPQPNYVVYYDLPPKLCKTPDKNILESVVRVATGDGGDASGVVVGEDRVLTAAHVVIDAGMTLVRVDEQYRKADILGIDPNSDLALLHVETGSLKPLQLAQFDLDSYEEVWAIGYPLALDQVTTHGFVHNESQGRIFASAPIDAGASGGGLMRCRNGRFELAGLIRGYGAYRIGNELVRLEDLSIHTPANQIQTFVLMHGGLSL